MGDCQKLVAQNSYFAILITSLNTYLWFFYGRTTDFILCFISLSNEFLGNEDILYLRMMLWTELCLPSLCSIHIF